MRDRERDVKEETLTLGTEKLFHLPRTLVPQFVWLSVWRPGGTHFPRDFLLSLVFPATTWPIMRVYYGSRTLSRTNEQTFNVRSVRHPAREGIDAIAIAEAPRRCSYVVTGASAEWCTVNTVSTRGDNVCERSHPRARVRVYTHTHVFRWLARMRGLAGVVVATRVAHGRLVSFLRNSMHKI